MQELRLLNMKGQTVLRKSISGLAGEFNEALDLMRFGHGVYLLQIITDSGNVTKRLVQNIVETLMYGSVISLSIYESMLKNDFAVWVCTLSSIEMIALNIAFFSGGNSTSFKQET
ncbi:T9SS type A sorting domain-containing protein [Pontibacter sp. H249]|uniref:T9SS type A sorting domain-containing protein n=1 Tax=Pontibacter sp. H249 TaxID=3133420 RepID=UPI0030BA9B89